jgi:hypothetical protein
VRGAELGEGTEARADDLMEARSPPEGKGGDSPNDSS